MLQYKLGTLDAVLFKAERPNMLTLQVLPLGFTEQNIVL